MQLLMCVAVLFLLSSSLVVLPVISTNIEVIRHSGSPPSADAFSNPGCHASYCKDMSESHCYHGCCKCQCPNNKANYIVNKWDCFSRDELNHMNSTKCKYSMHKPSEPLLGLSLTEEMVNKAHFTDEEDHRTLILCNDSVQVARWEYRNAFGEWRVGEGGTFRLESYLKNGVIRDQHIITALNWGGKLDSKYAGLFIRLILTCEGREQGCFLAKISGTHTYDTLRPQTVRPTGHPVLTTTSTPTTSTPTTSTPTASTPTISTPKTSTSTISSPTTGDLTDSTPTTIGKVQNTKAYQKSKKDQRTSATNASAIFGPILGVLGLACLIGIVCLVAARYRKRKRREKDENNSVAALEEYQDPIYVDINQRDFDNPSYQINLKEHLGPLPEIPESGYQSLNTLTKKTNDYDNPINGVKPEVDYDNPPVGMQKNSDYDNPLVKDGVQNTGDYDNPPVIGEVQNTGDYDNPPVNGEVKSTDDYDNPPAKNDYDTPRQDAIPIHSDSDNDTYL